MMMRMKNRRASSAQWQNPRCRRPQNPRRRRPKSCASSSRRLPDPRRKSRPHSMMSEGAALREGTTNNAERPVRERSATSSRAYKDEAGSLGKPGTEAPKKSFRCTRCAIARGARKDDDGEDDDDDDDDDDDGDDDDDDDEDDDGSDGRDNDDDDADDEHDED